MIETKAFGGKTIYAKFEHMRRDSKNPRRGFVASTGADNKGLNGNVDGVYLHVDNSPFSGECVDCVYIHGGGYELAHMEYQFARELGYALIALADEAERTISEVAHGK